jgi:hypothetical protein
MREKTGYDNVIARFCDALDGKHEPRQTSWLVFRNSTGASHFMGPPSSSSFPGSSVERG